MKRLEYDAHNSRNPNSKYRAWTCLQFMSILKFNIEFLSVSNFRKLKRRYQSAQILLLFFLLFYHILNDIIYEIHRQWIIIKTINEAFYAILLHLEIHQPKAKMWDKILRLRNPIGKFYLWYTWRSHNKIIIKNIDENWCNLLLTYRKLSRHSIDIYQSWCM